MAVIDPATERASNVVQKKQNSSVAYAYQNTRVVKSLDEFTESMVDHERPRAAIIGSPPMFRGTMQPGKDIELQILKKLPGIAIFVEKPAATGPEHEIADAFGVAKQIREANSVCSVGYFFLSGSLAPSLIARVAQVYAPLFEGHPNDEAHYRGK